MVATLYKGEATMITELAPFADTATGWQRALYAFLAEKEQRSGSRRTVEGYSRMLQDFFGRLGKLPDQVSAQDVFVYAHGPGLSGKQPSGLTIGARIACLSSFYRFLIRMDIVKSNPCDKLQRPQVAPSPPRGLSSDQMQKLLMVVPDSPVGTRDRAIILTLVLTGRRRAEVIGMKASDLSVEGDCTYYTYRGKGGKRGRRELPEPAVQAIKTALAAFSVVSYKCLYILCHSGLDPESTLSTWIPACAGMTSTLVVSIVELIVCQAIYETVH